MIESLVNGLGYASLLGGVIHKVTDSVYQRSLATNPLSPHLPLATWRLFQGANVLAFVPTLWNAGSSIKNLLTRKEGDRSRDVATLGGSVLTMFPMITSLLAARGFDMTRRFGRFGVLAGALSVAWNLGFATYFAITEREKKSEAVMPFLLQLSLTLLFMSDERSRFLLYGSGDSHRRFLSRMVALSVEKPKLFGTTAAPVPASALHDAEDIARIMARLAETPLYQSMALGAKPPARTLIDNGTRGVHMTIDFHMTTAGPKLIEFNVNGAGAEINAGWQGVLRRMGLLKDPMFPQELAVEEDIFNMFMEEWRAFSRATGRNPLRRPRVGLVVDENLPKMEYRREFEETARLWRERGIYTVVGDSRSLRHVPDDSLVYSRLPLLPEFEHPVMDRALEAGRACITATPRRYGLILDKRILIRLREMAAGQHPDLPLNAAERALLGRVVPNTRLLGNATERQGLWVEKDFLFFKLPDSFGGRTVYPGTEITRAQFNALPAECIVQELIPPPTVNVPGHGTFKYDVRFYAYNGRVYFGAARLYQGAKTNRIADGGGWVPLVLEKLGAVA